MMLSSLFVPLRAFAISVVGAGLAWGWYSGHPWLTFVAPAVAVAIGIAVSEVGVRRVRSDPVTAVRLMPWRLLVPAAVAAAAAGLVIIVTVEVTLPDTTSSGATTSADLKEIVSTLSTAITAFLASGFIDWTGDSDDSRVADWIKGMFRTKYVGVFAPGTAPANVIYSDLPVDGLDGWGAVTRARRAERIAQSLATG